MLMCSSRCFSLARVSPFLIMLIIVLSLHAETASAALTGFYDAEYVRNDVPVSQIKKGTVLGTLYMKSLAIQFYTNSSMGAPP